MFEILSSANGIMTITILIISIISSYILKRAYRRYNSFRIAGRLKTQDIARKILDANGLNLITVECSPAKGKIAEFYPNEQTLEMGLNIYSCDSIAAIAITAREVGKIIRYYNDGRSFHFIKFFSGLSTSLYSIWLLILYIMFRLRIPPYLVATIYKYGFLLLLFAFILRLITIPFILDEASTAKKELEDRGIIFGIELFQVERMLVREVLRGLTFF